MSLLDRFLGVVPVAVTAQALAAMGSNVAFHPAAAPTAVRDDVLKRPGAVAGDPRDIGLPPRVIAILGPGATYEGLATNLMPRFTAAHSPKPVTQIELQRGLLAFNRDFLGGQIGWVHHKVGVCVPLPIEIDGTGWVVNAQKIRDLSDSLLAPFAKRLKVPPTALAVPEPAQIEGEARNLLGGPFTLAGSAAALWERVMRNPFEAVLPLMAVLEELKAATPAGRQLAFAFFAVDGAKPHQLAFLARTSAGNGILRRIDAALRLARPPDVDAAKLTAAMAAVDNALHEGPAGARKLVQHEDVPTVVAMLADQGDPAEAKPGATIDPEGGQHRWILGRDVAAGRSQKETAAGKTFNGPKIVGRLDLDRFLTDDDKALTAGAAGAARIGRLALLGAYGIRGGPPDPKAPPGPSVRTGRLDAVNARDPGLLAVGLGGWTALAVDGLLALLRSYRDDAPAEFDLFFRLHGLDVVPDPVDNTKVRLAKIGTDDKRTVMTTDADLRLFFGGKVDAHGATAEWAARLRLPALVSRRYRRAQVLLAVGRMTPNPLALAIANVNPFPSKYVFAIDSAKSAIMKSDLDDVMVDNPPAHPVGFLHKLLDDGIKCGETLSGAIVDLTNGLPALPVYAGIADDATLNVGSMDKMPAMYAAFELRHRVRKAATAVQAAIAAGAPVPANYWPTLFLPGVKATWAARVVRGFPGLDAHTFPDLKKMFTVSAAGVVEFTKGTATDRAIGVLNLKAIPTDGTYKFRELMKSMIFMSNQHAADQVIIALGYPYLNGALRDAGFFEPAPLSSGIWISGSYDSHDWAKDDVFELSTRGQKHYQQKTNFVGTARQFATLLALLDRRLLFDATAAECNEMKEILRKDHRGTDPIDNCFVRLAVEGTPGITLETWASKIGIGVRGTNQPGMKGFHDCAIVERKKGAITLRYVLVIAGGLSDDTLPEGTPDPQTTGWYKFIRHLDGIVAKQHP